MKNSFKKLFILMLALVMTITGVRFTDTVDVYANTARNCIVVTHWRVNRDGDTNVRWNYTGANAGSIFRYATLMERGNTARAHGGWVWQQGRIGGPATAHNGWGGNIMWAVRTQFINVGSGIEC